MPHHGRTTGDGIDFSQGAGAEASARGDSGG